MSRPYAPFPPEPAERITLMGVSNGLWRFTFLIVYFTLVAVTVKGFVGMPEPSIGELFLMHGMWAVCAAVIATQTNREICGMVNEAREEDYLRALARAERAMPVEAMRLDPETETFIDVRRPPMMDPRIGLMRR
jgi:hypothetical protein